MQQNNIKDNTVKVNAEVPVSANVNVPLSVNGNSFLSPKKENSPSDDSQHIKIENKSTGTQNVSNVGSTNITCSIL